MKPDARIFYPHKDSPGIVCEVLHGYVYEVGEPNPRPLKSYEYGRWVKLVEVEEPTPIATDNNS